MQEGKFSLTAHSVAVRRAAHQLFDRPKFLDDPLALRIIGDEAAASLNSGTRRQRSFSRSFRAFMAVRSRYAEDQLAAAVERGVEQYVVLGAGLDTFACRNPHADLRVFEVDHPATQAWKLDRLRVAGISVPPSVTFVPVNFEQQALASELERAGFRADSPAFFSWLGVTPYITRESCFATFAFIARMPPGSGVAFDFAVPADMLNWGQKLALAALSARVKAAGEPFRLFFRPDELETDLKRLGFRDIEILDGKELNSRYFQNRTDGLQVTGGLGRLTTAWV